MEENRNEKIEGDVAIKSPFLSRLENFWYHYKWHTVAAVFIVIMLAVCITQCAGREKYDVYVTYAGGEQISHSSQGGDIPEYNKYLNALTSRAEDYDGNGKASVAFSNLFILSPEEKKEFGDDVDYSSMSSDVKTLTDRLYNSEYYVFFVSKYVYDEYHLMSDTEIFVPLAPYCPTENDFEFYTDRAVYLSSTDLYQLPVFCDMPADTLICLRIRSAVSSFFGGNKDAQIYERAEKYITSLFGYKHPSEE